MLNYLILHGKNVLGLPHQVCGLDLKFPQDYTFRSHSFRSRATSWSDLVVFVTRSCSRVRHDSNNCIFEYGPLKQLTE